MSHASYVGNFGTRMKGYPKRKPAPGVRPPFWIRFRRAFSGRHGRSVGKWIYTYWGGTVPRAYQFSREVIGSFRDFEILGPACPGNICEIPFGRHAEQDLYMERL